MKDLILASQGVVNNLIFAMAGLAMFAFFWGLVVFLFKSGDPISHQEGKNRMLWGIIALFVMVSIYGIIRFVSYNLGIGTF
jgi:hypothetical protein